MLFQDRLQSRELDDYEEEKLWKRIQRRYEGRESETDRHARRASPDVTKQEQEAGLSLDSTRPKFIRLYNVDTRSSSLKITVQLVRHQLRSCTSPEDFTRVFSVLLDRRPGMPNTDGRGAKLLANESTQRIIAHSLARYDARRALVSLSLLIRRLEENKQEIDDSILGLALRTSAQTHSFVALRKYLRMSADRQQEDKIGGSLVHQLSENILDGIKIGFTQGTPNPKAVEALRTLLYAPSPTVPRQEYLRGYLPRHFDALAKWVNILTECRAVDRLNQEWTWTQERLQQKKPSVSEVDMQAEFVQRSPRLFMNAFFQVGSPKDAWAIFEKYGSHITAADDEIWDQLVANVEHKPDLSKPLQQMLESMLAERLDKVLQDIEKKMGIAWVPGKNGDEGHHGVSSSNDQAPSNIEEEHDLPQNTLKDDVKAFTRFAVEREEEILAQKDDILAGRDPRPYKAPFS